MKKAALGLFLASLSFADVCEQVQLKKHLPYMPDNVEILSKREVFGLCEFVLKSGGIFTLYATKDFVLAGEMLSEGKSVSRESIQGAQSKLLKELVPKLREHVATTYGKGEKEVFFVSDPECPFCQAIKKRVKELADQRGYRVHLVWFPLRPQTKEKAISFICEKRTYEHYLQDAYGKSSCDEGIKKVDGLINLVSGVVSATPTFIFPDGRMVVGGNPKALEEAMK